MHRLLRVATFSALITLAAGIAGADDFDDGVAAYKNGDCATALDLWRPLAEGGDASAQFVLGVM